MYLTALSRKKEKEKGKERERERERKGEEKLQLIEGGSTMIGRDE